LLRKGSNGLVHPDKAGPGIIRDLFQEIAGKSAGKVFAMIQLYLPATQVLYLKVVVAVKQTSYPKVAQPIEIPAFYNG
jgi:hypothetical protein